MPPSARGCFDVVVIDPPFITAEVWEAYARAARALMRAPPASSLDGGAGGAADPAAPVSRVLCTTVAENADLLVRLFHGVSRTAWQPSIPHLVYQYDSYANWPSAVLGQANPEVP